MANKEKHNCNNCIHESVCEWAVDSEDIICKYFLDKKVLSERPHGEWITNYPSHFCNPGRSCSLCGKTVEFSENYCPNCGAHMICGYEE